jgi:dienelactone hydrolase
MSAVHPPVILFLHGLESGPNGSKARALASAGFRVLSPALPSRRALMTRDPLFVPWILLGVALTTMPAVLGASPLAAIVSGLAIAPASYRLGFAMLLRRQLDRCFAIAAASAAGLPEDAVLVGSSNGGGLAVRLLAEGKWRGPTVLLCPAQDKVARLSLRRPLRLHSLSPEAQGRVRVVHGDADDVVPLAHSQALVAGTRATLEVVPGGDHRLGAVATPEGLARWVRAAAAGPEART